MKKDKLIKLAEATGKACQEELDRFKDAGTNELALKVVCDNVEWMFDYVDFDDIKDILTKSEMRTFAQADDWYAVRRASWDGHLPVLQHFTKTGIDITEGVKALNWVAVCWASFYGHVSVLQHFRSLGINIPESLTKC